MTSGHSEFYTTLTGATHEKKRHIICCDSGGERDSPTRQTHFLEFLFSRALRTLGCQGQFGRFPHSQEAKLIDPRTEGIPWHCSQTRVVGKWS